VPEDDKVLMSKEEAFNKIVTLTGGRAAEALIFGSITTGAANDIEQATRIARAMITRYGMSEQFGMVALETVDNPYLGTDSTLACSQDTAARVDAEVMKLVQSAYEKATGILKGEEALLRCVARGLLERETLTGEEFMEMMTQHCELQVNGNGAAAQAGVKNA
jgi:cell division protease FtsH